MPSPREAAEFGIDFPILVDDTQLIGESLGSDPHGRSVRHRPENMEARVSRSGRRSACVRQRRNPQPKALPGRCARCGARRKTGRVTQAEAVGCIVNLPERDQRDSACPHFLLGTNRAATGQALRDLPSQGRRRAVGDDELRHGARFCADDPRSDPHQAHAALACRSALRQFRRRALDVNEEARILVHWIEAGAPRGAGPDPLAAHAAAKVRMDARQTGPHRRSTRFRSTCERCHQLPISARPESGGPRRLDSRGRDHSGRPLGRAPRAGRHRRSDQRLATADSRAARRTGRLCARQEFLPVSARHRHSAAQGSEFPLPDALHAQRQADHRRHARRLYLLRQAAEARARHADDPQYRADNSGQRQAVLRKRSSMCSTAT